MTWYLWSTRAGLEQPPREVPWLPPEASVSGDGKWAEERDDDGVVRVFVRFQKEAR